MDLLKVIDRVGLPGTHECTYIQISNENKQKVDDILSTMNIPAKTFNNVDKAFFEAKAEILLRGKLNGGMGEQEKLNLFQTSLDKREEIGKLLFENYHHRIVQDEEEMYSDVLAYTNEVL